MDIFFCGRNDVKQLAQMNRMLIEDENGENRLTQDELEDRMTGFLSGDYQAFLFRMENKVVGYALVNTVSSPMYLRHYFICREDRRKGYGEALFHALLAHLNIDTIDIDVYVWNTVGIAFWESLGFVKRCYNMRFKNQP